MKAVDRPPGELLARAGNTRMHPQGQIDMLAESIGRFGFVGVVLIDDEEVIVSGHGRVRAAIQAGLEAVPCVEIKDLSAEQVDAFAAVDNRVAEMSEWNVENLKAELAELREAGVEVGGLDIEPLAAGEVDVGGRVSVDCPKCGAACSSSQVWKPIKSPLHYPGGKSRAVGQILKLIPPDVERLCSPFMGGGSVELACASRGIKVSAYDGFEPLVNFWEHALADAPGVADRVLKHYPMDRERFKALWQSYFELTDPMERAAAFYAVNINSWAGFTFARGVPAKSITDFSLSQIQYLHDFAPENIKVEHADFRESIKKHSKDFLYLDPPYPNLQHFYGVSGENKSEFDHAGLAKLLRARKRWVLSYNDCELVRELYDGFEFKVGKWKYSMIQKKPNEVFIIGG